MSMLRRPHDHHRDLPARRDAAPSANRSNDQDRHFMTAPVPRCRKCARLVRWFSAGSDRARPNIRLSCQTAQLSAQFGAPSRSLKTRIPAGRRPASSHTQSTRSIRGTQIPIARDEPPSSPFPRFPPLEVFRRRPPMRAPPLPQRPASENLHKRRHWLAYSITSSARSRKRIIPFRRLLWCSTCVIVGSTSVVYDMASDEEVGRQILSIFMQHKVGASGVLRRNHFIDVRDADFQRGLNKAVENRWIKIKLRDRYTYELTEAGLAAGSSAGLPPGPLG